MPGPAVYVFAVAAVIGTVAAAVAFKEFVYDPHIAPQFEAWAEVRRRNRARRRGPVAVPAMAEAQPAGPSRAAAARDGSDGRRNDSDDEDNNDGMSVKLEDLVAREVAEWSSGSSTGPHGTLRQRRPRSGNVLDESNVFLPFDPISPTQLTASSSGVSSPAPGPAPALRAASPPIIYSPVPRVPASFGIAMQPAQPPASASASASTEPLSIVHVLSPSPPSSPSPSPSPSPPVSPSHSAAELARTHSASSSSSFTPLVIGPRSTDGGDEEDRTAGDDDDDDDDVLSLPSSPSSPSSATPSRAASTSPFVDVRSPLGSGYNSNSNGSDGGGVGSPFADVHAMLSPGMSSLHLQAESELAVLSPSLRSGMFSPAGTASSFDTLDDELSSWASASAGRRTPDA